MSCLLVFAVLQFLILFHEAGHFAAARAVGIALLAAIFLYATTMDIRRLAAWFSSGSMPS
jgi:membrane-associated protease RseP (regulator of RpoE activity)